MKPFEAGQTIACIILRAGQGGYHVTTLADYLPGFIQTSALLKPGAEIIGVFVGTHRDRILLSEYFPNSKTRCHPLIHRRASDLIMPPVDLKGMAEMQHFKISDRDLAALIAEIESTGMTGAIKVSSRKKVSRSCALLYQGRVVGCTFSSRVSPQALPTSEAMAAMLHDLKDGDTEFTSYQLPEQLVLPLSALYLGHPLGTNEHRSAQEYLDMTLSALVKDKATACLTIVWNEPKSTNLALVYDGDFVGVFNVEYQLLSSDRSNLAYLFEKEARAAVMASVLDASSRDAQKPFGYLLSETEPQPHASTPGTRWDTRQLEDPHPKGGQRQVSGSSKWRWPGYKAGQNVACKVNYTEKGGYAVTIQKDNLPGFLKSANKLSPGDEILGVFVCVHNGRILLSQLFSAPRVTMHQLDQTPVDWEEHLTDDVLDQAYEQQAKLNSPDKNEVDEVGQKEEAEGQGASKIYYRRATDLIMAPVDLKSIRSLKNFKVGEYDLEWLITDLEGGQRTACIKTSCKERQSRAGALLYRGRVVGCTYSSKQKPEIENTEDSLALMLKDLENPETDVTLYNLPEDIVAPMSALFLGVPIATTAPMTAGQYCDYALQSFAANKTTACLAIVGAVPGSTALVPIYKGQIIGLFDVALQQFTRDHQALSDLLVKSPHMIVEASSLEAEALDSLESGTPYGYSLCMTRARQRKKDD